MNRQQLIEQIKAKQSFLCVGLDPEVSKLPDCFLEQPISEAIFNFNKAIIDATAPYAVAYKPNLAFYERYGVEGIRQLDQTVDYLKVKYPEIFVIADAKRGDIGNTARMYAAAVFDREYAFDAITVAPYMGEDSVKPFLEYEDKWAIVLALTSNKGSQDFQMIVDKDGHRLFEDVLRKVATWGTDQNLMFVVGATQGSLLEDVRRYVPDHFLLVPGVGAQGGSLEEVAKYGMNRDCGLLVNSSRGIIFASKGADYAQAAATSALKLQQQMAQLLPW